MFIANIANVCRKYKYVQLISLNKSMIVLINNKSGTDGSVQNKMREFVCPLSVSRMQIHCTRDAKMSSQQACDWTTELISDARCFWNFSYITCIDYFQFHNMK